MNTLRFQNPTTGERCPDIVFHGPEAIDRALKTAKVEFGHWGRSDFDERSTKLRKAAQLLRENAESLAQMAAHEMGKPIAQGKAEAEKCAWVCEYYADNGKAFLRDTPGESTADETFLTYKPLGVVLAIMPWNFPFWQVFRAAAPILMTGNCFLLKHAPNVLGCAREMVHLMREAGFAEGAFSDLVLTNEDAGRVIADRRVAGVTLTGSTRAGRSVASTAGQHIKKSLLELGGSDPYVVLEDAPLDLTLQCCATSRMLNNGQTCISAKRFIVVKEVYDDFVSGLKAELAKQSFGDPIENKTSQGPMARHDLRDELARQVDQSVASGAELILGGGVPAGPGAYYPATMLTQVTPGMPAFDEELFGPVASIIRANNEAEAVELANQSPYGLGAAVFTRDIERGRQIARDQLDAGCCVVNDFVKSDPRVSFGGIRESGYGRELGRSGMLEFANIKSVAIKKPN